MTKLLTSSFLFTSSLLLSCLLSITLIARAREIEKTITINKIELQGNSVLTEFIREQFKIIEEKTYSITELNRLVFDVIERINQRYASEGYIGFGVYLPVGEDLSDGILTLQVREGKLERIDIEGSRKLCPSYVRDRVGRAVGTPLNVNGLNEALNELRGDPLISEVRGELRVGSEPNTRILKLNLEEAPATRFSIGFDNYESVPFGQYTGRVNISSANLTGCADRATVAFEKTEGLTKVSASYSSVPLNSLDGRVSVYYQYSDATVVQEPFRDLDLTGRSQRAGIAYRQPVIRDFNSEFALSLSLDWQQDENFLLGRPYDFIPGLSDGQARATSLRFAQEYINRSPVSGLALRSEFSVGLDLFDATIARDGSGVSGSYFSWRGYGQYLRVLAPYADLNINGAVQLSGNALLPGERFTIGGVDTVPGYDYQIRAGDSGFFLKGGIDFHAVRGAGASPLLTFSPFLAVGSVGSNLLPVIEPSTLLSTGLTVEANLFDSLSLRLDLAYPLGRIPAGSRETNVLLGIRYTIAF
jgi:hemolysin activation/secretion protein